MDLSMVVVVGFQRDVITVFVLSIFALVGLQLYQGSLRQKCVIQPSSPMNESQFRAFKENPSKVSPTILATMAIFN